jgi:AAA+ superfamily predicted ATPase
MTIALVYAKARASAPSVVFIDEGTAPADVDEFAALVAA